MKYTNYTQDLTDQEKKDLACVRSAKSGEMHNMFVICREYDMTIEEWGENLDRIKKDPVYHEKLRDIATKQIEQSKILNAEVFKKISERNSRDSDSGKL